MEQIISDCQRDILRLINDHCEFAVNFAIFFESVP